MSDIYIVTDNQYFALGIACLYNKINTTIICPQDLLDKKHSLNGGICYVYIKNRKLHHVLCRYLRNMPCQFIFFLPTVNIDIKSKYIFRFWPVKIDLNTLRKRFTIVSLYNNYNLNAKLSPASIKRIELMSQGIESYITWVMASSKDAKEIHRHYRAAIKSTGIDRVNVHNLFLAEYIAVGHMLFIPSGA